jgi:hypothetical protein
MVGLMWAVQLVIYPQFRSVSPTDFSAYAQAHAGHMVRLLAVFAPIEVVSALLVFVVRPGEVSAVVAFVAGALLAAGWVSTALWYAPLHGRLQAEGHDRALIDRLILTNWLRTALWTVRGLIVLIAM